MSNDIYWRLAAQYDGSIEQEKPTDSTKSAGTGGHAPPNSSVDLCLFQVCTGTEYGTLRQQHNQCVSCAGALALSGDGNTVAAMPPRATPCSVLDLEHGSHLRQHSLIKPGSNQKGTDVAPLCALSKSGEYLAVTFNDGFVSICKR